ncbi:trypsin-7-like [Anabrus simplex]|uniref:trypsin-7-like n=1 Tax=Anabrus simplex TaxID=316456 RepID=UPI0035A3CC86
MPVREYIVVLVLYKVNILIKCCLYRSTDAAPRALRRFHHRGGSRIVGGTDADIKDFPYQLSYQYFDYHVCGASIISEDWAITAAHCSDGVYEDKVSLRAGSSIIEEGGEVYEVAKIIINEQYDWYTNDNDICVLRVATKFRFGDGIAAIPLATLSPAAGMLVTITGWGATSEGGVSTPQLKQVQVPVVDHDQCNEAYKQYGGVADSMLCAGLSTGGKDACQGDSGGPYVANGELVGLVSSGLGCGRPQYPGLATDVANLRSWVTEKTGI